MKRLLVGLILVALAGAACAAPAPLPRKARKAEAPMSPWLKKDLEDIANLIKETERKIEFEIKTNPQWEATVPYMRLELERLRKFYARRKK